MHLGWSNDDYDYAWCFLPGLAFDQSTPTPVVLWHHGSTANEQQMTGGLSSHAGAQSLLDGWLDAGYVVLSLRLGTSGVADFSQPWPYWVSGGSYNPGDVVVDPTGGASDASGIGPLFTCIAAVSGSTAHPTGDTHHWRGDNNDGKWGNEPLRKAAKYAWIWANGWMNPDAHGLVLAGFSAGGCSAPNVAYECARTPSDQPYTVPVACVALIDPACNLADIWAGTVSGDPLATARPKIGAAYGLASTQASEYGTSDWNAKILVADGGHDPHLFDLSVFPHVPMLFSASYGDTTVEKSGNTDVWVPTLQAAGWSTSAVGTTHELTLITTSGAHGATSHFDPSVIMPFVARALAL